MSVEVAIEILETRGYTIDNYDDEEIYFTKEDDSPGKLIFLEQSDKKTNIDELKPIFQELMNNPMHLIIVYDQITKPALKSFEEVLKNHFKNVEMIQRRKLMRNILKHKWNPYDFRKLSDKEKVSVLKKFGNINPRLFPSILPTDAISIILGFNSGDIIEVKTYYNYTTFKMDRSLKPQITYQYCP